LDDASNDWERKFLNDMYNKMIQRKVLSAKQLSAILRIVVPDASIDNPASEKQIRYIKRLGGEPPNDLTKQRASEMITELLRD